MFFIIAATFLTPVFNVLFNYKEKATIACAISMRFFIRKDKVRKTTHYEIEILLLVERINKYYLTSYFFVMYRVLSM